MFDAKTFSAFADTSEMPSHFFHSGSRKEETEQSRHCAVKEAIVLMQARYQDPLTLEMIASAVQFSPFHFNRIFRSMTGVPPSIFLAALRINEAKKKLLRTNHRVTSICFDVGYNSLGTFTTRFTQLVGVTPSQLRRISQDQSLGAIFQDWDHLTDLLNEFKHRPQGSTIEGNISICRGFQGLIFIGLFRDPIPQGDPVSFTVLTRPGYYRLTSVPNGEYHLFATALQLTSDFRRMLESDAYDWCARQLTISMPHENRHMALSLQLVAKSWADIPILLALPWLLTTKLTAYQHTLSTSLSC